MSSSPVNLLKYFYFILSSRDRHCWPSILDALTLKVNATTYVAEVFAASTLHMVAALGFFDPEFAERTHLVLGTFHELLKGLFILVRVN